MIAAYRYDAFNRRIIKTVDQTTYRYTYDDWNIVEISTSANDYINIIDHGMDNHIAIEVFDGTNSEIYYFLSDERGNVVALTDEIGNIVERYRYLVYGEHIVLNELFVEKNCGVDTCYAGNLHNFLWGGSMYEPETDLYWMRNRYYHKGMKRFINQDPRGEVIHPDCSELFEFSRYFSTNDETNSGSLFVEEAGGKEPKSGQCNKSEDGLLCPTIWGDANNLGNGFAYVAGMVIEGIDPTGLEVIITINRTEVEDGVMQSTITVESTVTGDSWSGVSQETIMDKGIVPEGTYENATVREDGSKGWRVQYIDDKGKHNWTVVQIHVGNYKGDSDGCLLPGTKRGKDKDGSPAVFSSGHKDGQAMNSIRNIVEGDGSGKITVNIQGEKIDSGQVTLSSGKVLDYEMYKHSNGSFTVYYSDGTVVHVDKKGNRTVLKEGDDIEQLKADGLAYPIPGEHNPLDKLQNLFMQNLLSKMLKQGDDSQPPVLIDTGTGPNGAIMFFRNPYYKNKDPMKSIFIDGSDGSGRPMFVRNPFAPPGEGRDWRSTADYWFHSGFNRGEIGPGWN